jgi:NADPH:quinone reductase-like Zn-dependent oxidoreductase
LYHNPLQTKHASALERVAASLEKLSNGTYITVGGKTSRILQIVLFGKLSGKHKMHMVGYKANKDLNYLVELLKDGKLRPVIDKCFPLEETADAFRYFGEGRFKGKIVITLRENREGVMHLS